MANSSPDRKYPPVSFERKKCKAPGAEPFQAKPEIRQDDFLVVGGMVLGKICVERGTLQIKDKNSFRSIERGTCIIEVSLLDLCEFIKKIVLT